MIVVKLFATGDGVVSRNTQDSQELIIGTSLSYYWRMMIRRQSNFLELVFFEDPVYMV